MNRPIVHNIACITGYWEQEYYTAIWPKHCRACGGMGGYTTSGSYYSPPEFVCCTECLSELICPRCGEQGPDNETHKGVDEDGEHCASCGWNFLEPDGYGEYYCECALDFMEEALDR